MNGVSCESPKFSAPTLAVSTQACASELEAGSRILGARGSLLEVEGGTEYLRGLGQLYLARQLLEAAMMAHVQRAQRPPAFRQHLDRCSRAWSSGQNSLLCTA